MEQTISPDTHAFVKEMTAAGMSEPVAEAFVTNYTKTSHRQSCHEARYDNPYA